MHPFVEALVLVFHLVHLVERQIAADGEAEGFDGFDLVPLVAPVSDLNHRFLYNILSLRRIESDAECQSVEFVL